MSLTLVTEMLRNELKQIALSKAAFVGPLGCLGAGANALRSPHHYLTSNNFPCAPSSIHLEGAANPNVEVSPSVGNKHLFSSVVSSTEDTTIPHVSNLHIPRADSSSSLPDYDSHPDSGAASGTHHGLLSSRISHSQSHSTSRQYTPDVPCMNLLGDLQGSLQQLGLLVEMGLVLGKITSGLSVLADGTYDSMLCDVFKVFEKVQTLTQRMGRSQNVLWNIDRKTFKKGKQYSHPDVLMFVLISALTQLLPHSDMIKIKATFIPVEEVTRLMEDATAARAMAAIADIISPAIVIGRVGILMTELEIFGDANNLKEIVSKLHVTSNDEDNGNKSGGVNSQSDSSSSGDIVDPTPFIDPDVEEFGGSIFALGSLLDNVLGGSSYVMKNHGCVFSFSIPMRIEFDSLAPNNKESNNAFFSNPSSEKRKREGESIGKREENKSIPLESLVHQGTAANTVGHRYRVHTVLPSIPSVVGEDMSENSSMYHQNLTQEASTSAGMDVIDDADSVDEYDIIEDEKNEAFLKPPERSSDRNELNTFSSDQCNDNLTHDISFATNYDFGKINNVSSDTGSQSSDSSKDPAVIYIKGEPILTLPDTPAFFQQSEMKKIRLINLAELAQKKEISTSEVTKFPPLGDDSDNIQVSGDAPFSRNMKKAGKTKTIDSNLSQNVTSAGTTVVAPPVQVTSTAKNEIVMSLKDMITGHVPTRDRPLRVLMVDDSLTVQKVMGIWLSKKNCVVTQALNGQVALDLMKNTAFDIVFMDFLMPVMDGLACMRLYDEFICTAPMSQRPIGFEHQWIIGLSATALPSDQEAAFQVNMHMFCAKPVDMQALSYVLEAKRHGLTYEAIRDIASSNRAVNMSTQQKNDASIIMVPDSVDSNLCMDRETMRTKLDNNFNMNIFGSFVFNL